MEGQKHEKIPRMLFYFIFYLFFFFKNAILYLKINNPQQRHNIHKMNSKTSKNVKKKTVRNLRRN